MKKQTFKLFILALLLSCGSENNPLKKAKAFIEIQRYENAVDQAEMAIQENPKNAEAHFVKAKALYLNGDIDESEDEFSTAILLKKGIKGEIALFYMEKAMNTTNRLSENAEELFLRAIEYDPALGKKITSTYSERAFEKIEITPEINDEDMKMLDLAVKFADPSESESQKEAISQKLLTNAIIRKDRGFIQSSAILILKAIEFDPLIQKKAIPVLTDLGYNAIDRKKDITLGLEILQQSKEHDANLDKDPKFNLYYHFLGKEELSGEDVQNAEKFLVQFKKSPYCENIYYKLIQHYYYSLDVDKTQYYLAMIKNEYPNSQFQKEISTIENDLKEMQ